MRNTILAFGFIMLSCNNNKNESTTKTKDTVVKSENTEVAKDSPVVASGTGDTEQMVAEIRKEFQRIGGLKLAQKKYPFECDNDPANGTATYYTEDGKVVKLYVDWGVVGDYYSTTEYYFKNEKLIFIFESVTGGPAMGPDKTTEKRIYINNDKTIRFIKDKKTLPCETCEYTERSHEYKMLKAFNTNNAKKAICDFD